MNLEQQRTLAEKIAGIMMQMDPRWLDNIRDRLSHGETYDEWRVSFQRLIDVAPPLQAIVAKPDGEQFLRMMMWEVSREKAGARA